MALEQARGAPGGAATAFATPPEGLTSAEVAERVAQGLTNTVSDVTSRSVWDIVRANVLTLFNAIVAGSFVLLLVLGQWRDALFGLSAVANAVIGVVQEYRAKRSLDRLAVVNAPRTRVLRDREEVEIPIADVVLDDVLVLRPGDQLPADGTVVESEGLEVDESVLTGEADPVAKEPGAGALSGSSVLAGTGLVRVTKVGDDSFASELTAEAKRFSLVASEIRAGLDRVLRWITWMLAPIMLIVINGQMQVLGGWETAIRTGTWRTGAVGAVASTIAMIPLGLVLLTSVAMAVGGVRLARQKVLVRELAAVEGLARVDMLCLDKTGTITEGAIAFDATHPVGATPPDGWRDALAWFGSDPNANATARSLTTEFPVSHELTPVAAVRFNSTRKWSAAQFGDGSAAPGTWVLGAPELVLRDASDDALRAAADLAAGGRRTLVLAATTRDLRVDAQDQELPPGLRAVVLLTFTEVVRPDARQTLDYFRQQDVQIRILSGDDPRTVGAVARQVGLDAGDCFDARRLPEDQAELGEVLENHVVFGRVTPEQKRHIVRALQSRGHVVAMTGDGVNDVLALKDADMGIAMNTATAATKAVSRLVLLDGRFDRLPSVVAEGRRVIANIERVSMLFLAKTSYAILISVVFGALLWGFPFLPRQLSVTDGLTIGIPAFFLALMANPRRYRSGFLRRSLLFAVPAGAIVTTAITAVHIAGSVTGADDPDAVRSASVITLTVAGLWILVVISRPLDARRILVIAAMFAGAVLMFAVPFVAEFLVLPVPPPALLIAAGSVGLVAAAAVEVLDRVHRRWVRGPRASGAPTPPAGPPALGRR
ncbi:HAD-IC family P-type ATPase [Naasia sp. SYSU D00948]|uniref:HAD-IC family P-type ATPase n=1 Tax=Naasia sp. SYSU D00948 TaxID=2817379 RepID=UPI001B312B33|nr:HAD-IC family P-type ATPase [Naasia sp. SYSU D00948]